MFPLTPSCEVRPEKAKDRDAIEGLLDAAFGAGRHSKTAYRFRENVDPVPELSFVVDCGENSPLAATIRYWPILLPDDSASLLLGPIAVDPKRQQEGIGVGLMNFSMNQARALGYNNLILVGDAPYYARFGFGRACMAGLDLGGPVDTARFLGLEWVAESLSKQQGVLRKWPKARALPHYKTLENPANPRR